MKSEKRVWVGVGVDLEVLSWKKCGKLLSEMVSLQNPEQKNDIVLSYLANYVF